jgi:hypothetical protein
MKESLNILSCHRCDRRERNCVACKCSADPAGRAFFAIAEEGDCPLGRHGPGAREYLLSIGAADTIANLAAAERGRIGKFHDIWSAIHTTAAAGTLSDARLDEILKGLPCGTCLDHFKAIRAQIPLPADPAKQLEASWAWHEAVNARLGKPGITLEEAKALYASPKSEASANAARRAA